MKVIVDGKEVDNIKLKFDDMKEMLDFGCMMHSVPSVGALGDGETWEITNIKATRPKWKTISIETRIKYTNKMAERKTIGSINIITDSETSYENIGDVDGGFNETELKKHIEAYGHKGLCEKLTAMSWQVWNMLREVNVERDKREYATKKDV